MGKSRKLTLDSGKLRNGSDIAEIGSYKGHWLVVQVNTGDEGIAAAHLIARGYGIFIPGRYSESNRVWISMFAGYIFVYVFGIEHHRSRILSCPGVTDFMYEISHPSCPYVVPDQFIDSMRRYERKSIEDQKSGVVPNGRKRHRRRRKSLRIRNGDQLAA